MALQQLRPRMIITRLGSTAEQTSNYDGILCVVGDVVIDRYGPDASAALKSRAKTSQSPAVRTAQMYIFHDDEVYKCVRSAHSPETLSSLAYSERLGMSLGQARCRRRKPRPSIKSHDVAENDQKIVMRVPLRRIREALPFSWASFTRRHQGWVIIKLPRV